MAHNHNRAALGMGSTRIKWPCHDAYTTILYMHIMHTQWPEHSRAYLVCWTSTFRLRCRITKITHSKIVACIVHINWSWIHNRERMPSTQCCRRREGTCTLRVNTYKTRTSHVDDSARNDMDAARTAIVTYVVWNTGADRQNWYWNWFLLFCVVSLCLFTMPSACVCVWWFHSFDRAIGILCFGCCGNAMRTMAAAIDAQKSNPISILYSVLVLDRNKLNGLIANVTLWHVVVVQPHIHHPGGRIAVRYVSERI